MPFDLEELDCRMNEHAAVARVVIVKCSGSVPREVGTSMLVWKEGQSGTIGGGALEFNAAAAAREILELPEQSASVVRMPLGPGLGQCCGGTVTLVTEVFRRQEDLPLSIRRSPSGIAYAVRQVAPGVSEVPERITTAVESDRVRTLIVDGWLAEAMKRTRRPLWLYGAGHVGRAVASVLVPLDSVDVVWVDMSKERFPGRIPDGAQQLVAANPAAAVEHAPPNADHLVMTHSHALDLEICDRVLRKQFNSAGLIGSKSKWARFRKRLIEAGHAPSKVDRISCPIGIPSLGKHPQAIAVGVACKLLDAESGETVRGNAV